MFKSAFSLIVILLCISPALGAMPGLQQEGLWNRGNYFQAVHTGNQRLLAIYENGLDIFRTEPQGALEHLGKLELGLHKPTQILADASTAYILTDDALLLVDIGEPQTPKLLSEIAIQANSFYLNQTTLYLFGEKVTRMDVSQPQAPQVLFENEMSRSINRGYLLEGRLVTINSFGEIDISEMQPDGSLVSILQNEPGEFRLRGLVAHQGNRLYESFGGITAYEISAEGLITQLGRFQTNLIVRDLAVYDDVLVIAGFQSDFAGLELVRLGSGDAAFQDTFRLPKGPISAIHAVDQKQFFGLSPERGIEQFRPEASFAKITSFSQGQLAVDVAFIDPYLFLASPDQLEVLSFANPAEPVITASYPGLQHESQKVLYQDGMLHLASPNAYKRYTVATDGLLTLEHAQTFELEESFVFGFNEPQMKAIHVEKDRVLLAVNRDLVTILEDRIIQKPITQNEFGVFSSNNQVLFAPPYLIARDDHILDFHTIGAVGVPILVATQRLTQSSGPLPHPTTLHGNFLLAGPQVFDIRNKKQIREYPKAPTNLEDATLLDEFIYGVGPNGLQIWDFGKLESPNLLWEQAETTGERIFLEGDRVVTFRKSPNVISYFSQAGEASSVFFPFIDHGFPGQAQLVFVNTGDEAATLKLRAVNIQGQKTERELTLAPQATLSDDVSNFFPSPSIFNLLVEAPRAVKTTYYRGERIVNGQLISASMTNPMPLETLNNRLVLNVPSSDSENKVIISPVDSEPNLNLNLQFFGESGLIDETEIFLFEGIGIDLTPSFFFNQVQPGQAGVIIATAAEGTRLAGTVLTNTQLGPESMSGAFSPGATKQSQVRCETLGRLGSSNSYSRRRVFNGDLLLAGASGILISDGSADQAPIIPDHQTQDAVMDEDRIWVLTSQTVEVRQRQDGKLLFQMPNTSNATRIYRNGDHLFLWNPQFVSILALQMDGQDRLFEKETLATQGLRPREVVVLKGQLFAVSDKGLLTYQFSDSRPTTFTGNYDELRFPFRMSTDGERIFFNNINGLIILKPQANALPSLDFIGPSDDNILAINDGLGLTYNDDENRYAIVSLPDFSPIKTSHIEAVGRLRYAQFSENRIWLINFDNEIFEYNVTDPAQPVFRGEISESSAFSYLARVGSRVFTSNFSDGRHILHELHLSEEGLTSNTWDMGEGEPTGLVARGDYLYLSDREQGVLIVQLNSENGPTKVGEIVGSTSEIEVGDELLVTLEDSYLIRVYDLQNPIAPQLLSESITPEGPASATALDGNLLLITSVSFGLSIIDLSDPRMPQERGSVPTAQLRINARSLDVAFFNNYAYLADRLDLTVVDYRDPANLTLVKRIPFASNLVQVREGYLFNSSSEGLTVFDLSNPEDPKLLGSLPGKGIYDSVLEGRTLYTSTGFVIQASSFQPVRATVPWVVGNSRFQSKVQISNSGDQPQSVQLRAIDTTGASQSSAIELLPFSQQEITSTDLFPDMSGYALAVESASPEIQASFSTLAIRPEAASQAQALARPSNDLRDGLVLNFPAQSSTAALVVLAPFNPATQAVQLRLFGPDGFIAETSITLVGSQPTVNLLTKLFPQATAGSAYMVTAATTNGVVLDGSLFLFDNDGRPATVEGSPQNALFLANPKESE